MTDVKVKQCDRDAAASFYMMFPELSSTVDQSIKTAQFIKSGGGDGWTSVKTFAAFRQAAEKAQQERDAAYIEGKGGVIPGATVFVSVITGENMPCMSGDARDKLNPHKRRQFDDATRDLATAIRSQGHE